MKALTALLVATLLFSSTRAADDWIPLFDGQTLTGWKAGENPTSFKVADGAIYFEGPRAHCFYDGPVCNAQFKNFEFKADVKAAAGSNSGIFFHTHFSNDPSPKAGYEAQIENTPPRPDHAFEHKKTGSLYAVRNLYKLIVKSDEWFTMSITVRGKHIQVRVNDTITADYIEPRHAIRTAARAGRLLSSGTFALQGHDPRSKVWFKNLLVRPLPDTLADDVDGPVPDEEPYPELLKLHMAQFPVIDLHSHLKGGLTLDDVLALSRRTGINFGVAVNGGIGFPINDDKGISEFVASMAGKPVFVGMQAEGREWVKTFSPEAIAKFDYVFTDSMTFVDDRTGKRTRLWMPGEYEVGDEQQFMEMLVKKIETILDTEPIDMYVNPTFLPEPIAKDYDRLWTPERMNRVVAALARNGVALEINARYKLPCPALIKLAKQAGVKFTFGTNNKGKDDLGVPEYCLQMVKECGLTDKNMFFPLPGIPKAIERKKPAAK